MIFEYIVDTVFGWIYYIIDWLAASGNWALSIPDSIYNFLVTSFSYLAFFVPLSALAPLITYHAYILGLRIFMMILGLIKRIPLA